MKKILLTIILILIISPNIAMVSSANDTEEIEIILRISNSQVFREPCVIVKFNGEITPPSIVAQTKIIVTGGLLNSINETDEETIFKYDKQDEWEFGASVDIYGFGVISITGIIETEQERVEKTIKGFVIKSYVLIPPIQFQ
jgi:hypothetical protein